MFLFIKRLDLRGVFKYANKKTICENNFTKLYPLKQKLQFGTPNKILSKIEKSSLIDLIGTKGLAEIDI